MHNDARSRATHRAWALDDANWTRELGKDPARVSAEHHFTVDQLHDGSGDLGRPRSIVTAGRLRASPRITPPARG